MNKVEDKALKAYPIKIAEHDGYDENIRERKGFVKGYHQAEKDLELTWEEIYSILYFEREVLREFGNEEHSNEEVCKEVLKRFKETKIPHEIII